MIRVRCEESSKDGIKLVVEDNGIGFEAAYAERIFQPFQRLHSRGTFEGNGIGLAICRKIVERHGGQIYAESIPGQGSRFIITFPQASVFDQQGEPK
jgi:signal transduction histidine kinase